MAKGVRDYVVSLNSEERQNKIICEESMQKIIQLIDAYGLIIIDDALDADFWDKMSDRIREVRSTDPLGILFELISFKDIVAHCLAET